MEVLCCELQSQQFTYFIIIEHEKGSSLRKVIVTEFTIVYSRSVDPRNLCVGIKYYIVHMYSMPYYTYGSTANFLVLVPTALIYISKEQRCNEDLRGVGNFKIDRVIR